MFPSFALHKALFLFAGDYDNGLDFKVKRKIRRKLNIL